MTEIKESGLKLKDGKILGLSDLIGQIKEKNASAFVDEQQQRAQQQAARFTTPGTGRTPGGHGTMTKKIFMQSKTRQRDKRRLLKISDYLDKEKNNRQQKTILLRPLTFR